jgi:hypothetical protein
VEGHGTTANLQSYSFTDAAPLTGNNYYRLAQVDLDGHTDYSDIRLLTFRGQSGRRVQVFPNPTKELLHIMLPAAATGQGMLQLYNTTGSKVMEQAVLAGSTQVDIYISSLAAGIYILKYDNESVKVVKQ